LNVNLGGQGCIHGAFKGVFLGFGKRFRLLFAKPGGAEAFSALPLKVCHKKQEKTHPTLETIDGKEP
jgi:hypothetical protein